MCIELQSPMLTEEYLAIHYLLFAFSEKCFNLRITCVFDKVAKAGLEFGTAVLNTSLARP